MLSSRWFRRSGTIAIFDVREGSVGGALVHFTSVNKPLVRFAHRITYSPSGDSTGAQTLLLKALKTAAHRLCSHGLPQLMQEQSGCRGIDEVVLYLGAPYVTTHLYNRSFESKKAQLITSRWMKETLTQIDKECQVEGQLIEQHAIKALVNGYKTHDPYGKSAKRIDLSVLKSTADGRLLETLLTTLQTVMHTKKISAHTAALAHFVVIRDHFESEDNFLIVNISNNITEIQLIREDSIAATATLRRGSHALLESAAARLNSVPEEVLSVLRMRAAGDVEENNKGLQSELAMLETDWQRAFDEGFAALKAPHGLPLTVFLLAPYSVASWFSNLLRGRASANYTLTKEPFRVFEITGEEMLKHYHVHADVIPDGVLSLETLFLQKLGSSIVT